MSCNCNFPSCLGVYNKCVCLCIEDECIYYKPMCCVDNKPDPHTLCIISKSHYSLVMPCTLYVYSTLYMCAYLLNFLSSFIDIFFIPVASALALIAALTVAPPCPVTRRCRAFGHFVASARSAWTGGATRAAAARSGRSPAMTARSSRPSSNSNRTRPSCSKCSKCSRCIRCSRCSTSRPLLHRPRWCRLK